MEFIITNIGALASLIGSLTVVGSALMWIYNKFVGEPRERKRVREAKRNQEQMIELITQKNEPLNQSIESLIEFTSESKEDRQELHRVTGDNARNIDKHKDKLKSHAKQLNEHNGRLIALETKNGITTYKFKEDEK